MNLKILLTDILDELQKNGIHLAPTFVFIDPFGFKGAPFTLVARLLTNFGTEVFINIMIDFINRFVEHPLDIDRQHIRNLLGASEAEINQLINSQDRSLDLLKLYQAKLHQHANFVRYFEIRDEHNRVIYCLFFAGNHRLGHIKMKEAFWKADSQSGFTFSDHTNLINQPVLFNLYPSMALATDLKKHFVGINISAGQVITYVEDETAYLAPHAKTGTGHS